MNYFTCSYVCNDKESLEDAGFKEGDRVEALVKAINVVFVKQ
ncbi:hypothetical protein JTT01_12805 [Clostridium botulinum]|nr:hypothetical protein [Clostridium botulinum]